MQMQLKPRRRSTHFLHRFVYSFLEDARELGTFGVAGWQDLAGVQAAETGFAIGPLQKY